jgi:hypothetical protein
MNRILRDHGSGRLGTPRGYSDVVLRCINPLGGHAVPPLMAGLDGDDEVLADARRLDEEFGDDWEAEAAAMRIAGKR